jgi:hypothetical protein
MAGELWMCQSLAPDVRDWCALVALPLDQGSGRSGLKVCSRMAAGAARDRCVERMARHPNDPAPLAACAAIASEVLRERCVFDVAVHFARIAATDAAVEEALRVCVYEARDRGRCAGDVLTVRAEPEVSDNPADLEILVVRAIQLLPALASDASFGARAGEAARAVGYRVGFRGPCERLPSGAAATACLETLSAPEAERLGG